MRARAFTDRTRREPSHAYPRLRACRGRRGRGRGAHLASEGHSESSRKATDPLEARHGNAEERDGAVPGLAEPVVREEEPKVLVEKFTVMATGTWNRYLEYAQVPPCVEANSAALSYFPASCLPTKFVPIWS